jgi:hypothetical protein
MRQALKAKFAQIYLTYCTRLYSLFIMSDSFWRTSKFLLFASCFLACRLSLAVNLKLLQPYLFIFILHLLLLDNCQIGSLSNLVLCFTKLNCAVLHNIPLLNLIHLYSNESSPLSNVIVPDQRSLHSQKFFC